MKLAKSNHENVNSVIMNIYITTDQKTIIGIYLRNFKEIIAIDFIN